MDKLNVFLTLPWNPDYFDVYEAIKQFAEDSKCTLIKNDNAMLSGYISNSLENAIKNSDIIIADISEATPFVMYELGFAQTLEKPIITICNKDRIPFDLIQQPNLLYNRTRLQDTLIRPLRKYFETRNFDQFVQSEKIKNKIKAEDLKTVFISYSHEDVDYLKRLSVHLRPFEKKGLINLFDDTKIKVGEKWKENINMALDNAKLAILLISADFLASEFIVDNELPPLLKAAEEKGKLILPVILKPCSFKRDENLSKFQAINDPKIPLSRMDENGREEVYAKIADYIDTIVKTK